MKRDFRMALITIIKSPEYVHDTMLAKLVDRSGMIVPSKGVAAYVALFENVFNWGKNRKSQTYFRRIA